MWLIVHDQAMRAKLTSLFVESVKPPNAGQVDYWDRKTPGFGLRVSQGGRKAWVLTYRHQGRFRRLTLGTYPILNVADARDLAKIKLAEVQRGIDPATLKRDSREADTFAALADRYMAEHARMKKRASSAHEDEKMLRRALLPAWGARKAADVSRRDVIALIDKIACEAPIGANRVLSLASKIFNFAVSKEIIEVNPAYRVPKPGREKQRSRVLRDDEIPAVWSAFGGEAPEVASLFKVLLLTGQRRGEVIAMRWSEVDLDGAWWELPGERSKNGRLHRVPLVALALSILRGLRALHPTSDFVFPGHRKGQPVVNVAKPLVRIINRAGVAPFTVHDLRRTTATGMAKAGVISTVISHLLNHISSNAGLGRITAIYNRYEYDNEKRAALVRWEERLTGLLDHKLKSLDAA
jgi:integrase